MFRVICLVVLALAVGNIAPAVYAQTDSARTSTSVFDLQNQLSPIVLDTGLQYVPGTGVRIYGSATSGIAGFYGTNAPFTVNNVVPSWNVDLPDGTGVRTEIRAVNGGTATAWYEVARIGTIPSGITRKKKDSSGYIDDDTLMLYSQWPRIEYRVTLYTDAAGITPTLRLMSVCYADTGTRIPYTPLPNPTVTKSLPAPWRSQYWVPTIGGVICGPTSLSMAEEYLGVDLPTETVAADAYDSYNGIYGNWPFLAQAAAKHGLKAYMMRCNSQQPVRDEIAAGHPVILGVRWDPGELTNAPISSTGGHLILCVGITSNGDFIINDPAGSSSTWDHVVYNKDQMAHCWLNAGGVAISVAPNPVYGRYPYYTYKSNDQVATNAAGSMELFIKGYDSKIYHTWQTAPNGGWGLWANMGGSAISDPVSATNRTGGNAVFARFEDGNIYFCKQNGAGGAWSSWISMGRPGSGKPAVGKSPDGRMDVFCRMNDGSIQRRWEDYGGGWLDWVSLGGNFVGDPVVALNSDGREEVFVRGADSQLYHNWQLNDGSWSGWSSMGGPITGVPAIGKSSDGRIEIFCRFADGSMQHCWQNNLVVGTSWSGWSAYSGWTDCNLAAGRRPDGIQEVFHRGSTGQIYHSWQAVIDGDWSPWEALGGATTWAPILGHNDDGRLQCFTVQSDGRVWRSQQLTGGGWSSWSAFGGVLLDTAPPAIISIEVTPALVAAGDDVYIRANITDNIAVTSVTANGVSLVDAGGGYWSGTLLATSELGQCDVQIEARDRTGNSAACVGSYKTARVLYLNGRAAWDPITSIAGSSFLFAICGKAAVINDGVFKIDDGSGRIVDVYAAQHGVRDGGCVRVRGILSSNDPSDMHIDSARKFINPLN